MKRIFTKILTTIKKTLIYSAIVCAFGWAVYSGVAYDQFENGHTLVAYGATISTSTPPAPIEMEAPVLQRIADCESGNGKPGSGTHFKNGQVILRANTDSTVDIGKYQVNLTYWGKKASELGYDLTKEADNYAMAKWIYENKGTSDWSASQKCWYK